MLIAILFIILAALYLVFKLLEAAWVYCDAAHSGLISPCVWAVIVFFLPFAVIAYLFVRAAAGPCCYRGDASGGCDSCHRTCNPGWTRTRCDTAGGCTDSCGYRTNCAGLVTTTGRGCSAAAVREALAADRTANSCTGLGRCGRLFLAAAITLFAALVLLAIILVLLFA